ncbi:MAG: ABC transporter permease subunit [Desulfobacterales bacterium]
MNQLQSEKVPFYLDPRKRSVFYQTATMGLLALVAWYLVSNTLANLEKQSISTGFDFLQKEAAFEIGESPVRYSAADTYARALWVGVLNTLKVALVGIVLTIVLGTLLGIARMSSNWLISRAAAAYIEVMQNIPILLQLFFWYAIFYESLPPPREALHPVAGVFLCNRGIIFAVPEAHAAHAAMIWALAAAGAAVFLLRRWARKRRARTGLGFPLAGISLALVIGLPTAVWLVYGAPHAMSVPQLAGFNYEGGLTLSPEFCALLLGLVLYTAAFVAEIVRAGIQAVGKGQTEAAKAIGLRPAQILHQVILPQALRVIIPPLTSQMLNLTKNSSLAVAIGYPDFVSVANTTINQTGQSIEGVALIMAVYLFFSLSTSACMNWYNKRVALVER